MDNPIATPTTTHSTPRPAAKSMQPPFAPYMPSPACPLCGFDRRTGDAHMVWFDANCPNILPTWGCGIVMEVQYPQRFTIISSDILDQK